MGIQRDDSDEDGIQFSIQNEEDDPKRRASFAEISLEKGPAKSRQERSCSEDPPLSPARESSPPSYSRTQKGLFPSGSLTRERPRFQIKDGRVREALAKERTRDEIRKADPGKTHPRSKEDPENISAAEVRKFLVAPGGGEAQSLKL